MMPMKAALPILLLVTSHARAQSADVGSTGADGALEFRTPGTVVFNPASFKQPRNPAEGNVFHFTTVYIGARVVLKLPSQPLNGPVFWLVQGPVQIDGTIELSGDDGQKLPSMPGAGGYAGGAAGRPGYGPVGFRPNVFLVPLVGGTGGSGGPTGGGGAGGGAMLIASSTSIVVNGKILANGGASKDGAGGNGGAIRLSAPVIDGTGILAARGGQPGGRDGLVRIEALDDRFQAGRGSNSIAKGKPFGLFLPPDTTPSVRIASIGGFAVTTSAFAVNQSGPMNVVIESRNIPPGTRVELQFFAEDGRSTIVADASLEGTVEFSWASAEVTFQRGQWHGYVNAAWSQPPP